MFVILWEFEVKPGSEAAFEKAYGLSGAWVQLFQQDPHYRGTRLLRDVSRPLHFYTIDHWDSESDYRIFLERHQSAYQQLDCLTQGLTVHERELLACNSDQPFVL